MINTEKMKWDALFIILSITFVCGLFILDYWFLFVPVNAFILSGVLSAIDHIEIEEVENENER